jgi:hypothetical protein
MHALHLVHGLGMGGAEVALFYYIKALGMEDYDHYVYCFGPDGTVRERIESLGVPVFMGKRDSIKQPWIVVSTMASMVSSDMLLWQ